MTEKATALLARARKLRREGALDEATKLYREALERQPTAFDALRELGALCLMRGRPDEALPLFQSALRIKPKDFDALFGRANTLVAMKRYLEAVSAFEDALKIRPDSAEAHNNRGGALGMLRRHAEALESFEKAIQCKPDHFDAHNNRGNALKALGRREEALKSFDRVLELNPKMAGALYRRGVVLAALNRHEEAISSYDTLLDIKPDSAQAHYNRANSLKALNRHEDAIASYDQALTIKPRNAEALNNRGTSLQALNRNLEAIASFQEALAIKPNSAGVLNNRGNALAAVNRHEEAIADYDQALQIKPDYAEALSNRGATLSALNRFEEAIENYRQAVAIKPDYAQAHFNEAFARLVLGDYPGGWEKYEWRWKVENFPSPKRNYNQPLWSGREPLAGKTILLHAEQGFGDAIQSLRYVALVASKGGRVLLGVPSPLASLVQGLEGVANVTTRLEPREDFDLHCPLLSLPLAFGTTLETIPSSVPYLKAPPERVLRWTNRLGVKDRVRVGLTWSGNPRHKNDRNRSIPLTLLAPLFSLSAEFVCVQTELRDSDRQDLARHPEIRHFGKEIRDFSDTAALIELLDLVISVDTATAHLAGALGKPVWVLLPFAPDWRWLLDREDSPWYPTARLFRQPAPGNWKSVIDRARSELVSTIARSPHEGATTSVGLPRPAYLNTAHQEKSQSNASDRLSQAVALLKQTRLAEAEFLFRSILAEHPNHFDALHLLGVCKGRQGKHDEAFSLINEALKINPRSAEVLSNRGSALRNLNRYDEAIASFEQALFIQPRHTEALNNRGAALHALNRYKEAITSYEQALAIKSDYAEALKNRGAAFQALNRHQEAIASYQRAVAIKPDYAEAHANEALARLALGDFAAGWEKYEWRLRTGDWEPHQLKVDCPVWAGSALEGQVILVRGEQGLGDQIMFASCLPEIIAHAKLTIVEIEPRLKKLFGRSFPAARIYPLWQRGTAEWIANNVKLDCQVQIGGLPHRLGRDLHNFPKHQGYLVADPARVSAWRSRLDQLGPGPKVGISWRGGTERTRQATRSIALSQWTPILRTGSHWISLQYGESRAEIEALAHAEGLTVHHWREAIDDYDETAALVTALDLVVSVQTSIVHLTGALGKAVWVMVPATPEWRYLAHGETLPWYPTARLFRQPAPGAWHSVIERLRSELVSTFKGTFHEGAIASAALPQRAPLPLPHQGNLPSNASTTLNRAVALLQHGNLAEAEFLFRSILAAQPNHFDALHLLGVCKGKQGRHDEANTHINEALKINPRSTEALKNRGFALAAQNRHQEAIASYEQALAIKPDFVDALYDHGNALNALNRHQEALASFDRALLIEPNHVGVLNNRGNVLIALNRYDEALASFNHALTIKPDHVEAHVNRGAALNALNQHAEALASYDHALAISPDYVSALNNRGDILNSLSRHEEALASFKRALAIDPAFAGAHWNRSLSLLTIGNFNQGWQEYEWRMQCGNWEFHQLKVDCPVWTGSALEGQVILVRGEQGLGDQIMFASCLPEIIARAKLTIVEIDPRLKKLFGRSFPATRIYPLWRKGTPGWIADNVELDVQVQIGSLPHRLGRDLHNFPKHRGYLVADPARVGAWRSRLDQLGPGPKVGISWRGGTDRTRQATRSIALSQWTPILRTGAHWISLQYGECQAEIEALARVEGLTVHHWREAIDEYDETAALVAALDLVVSVQTSIVHLAGALGKAVWVMVPATPEWRYLAHGETLPWYPTARLFRQQTTGDWGNVIERIRSELVSTFKGTLNNDAKRGPTPSQPSRLSPPNKAKTPTNASDTFSRSVALFHEERWKEAERLLRSLLASHPNHFDSLHLLGVCKGRQGKHDEAYALINEALKANPSSAEALSNHGNALRALNRHEEAIASCELALAIRPDYAEALNNRGAALQALNQYHEAIASYEQALAIKPHYADALKNRGTALQALNRYQDAIASYKRALTVKPDFAEAHFSEGLARLTLGELPAAWEKYEWRWRMREFTSPKRNFKQPLWLGKEPLEGKTILLHAEQGLGDAIQFARYVPAVAQRGSRVFVEAPALLRHLLEGLAGIERVVTKGETLPEFNVHCPLLSLPLAFGTTLDTIPSDVPYVSVSPKRLTHWLARLGPRTAPRVGLCWSGRPEHKNDHNRSIALATLLPLTSLGLELVSIQKEIRPHDQAILSQCAKTRNFGKELKDFADTAALMSVMDLVISVDTAAAHLAGALGKPVWVLLPFAPDWRWMLDRDDSPWYPTARLFRQPAIGDWESVIRRVVEELQKRFGLGDAPRHRVVGVERSF